MIDLRWKFALSVWWLAASFGSTMAAEVPTPVDQVKQFKVAEGLDVGVFASEPVVGQPLCMTFDDRGRMWMIQYLQYPHPEGLKPVEVDQYLRTKFDRIPEPPPKGDKGRDRITILEDTNGDGIADTSKDFLSDLNIATGIALGHGGVFVANAPYLLFYPDRNQDDVPDGDPEVLLKGFGLEDTHAVLNSLTWGPDGWLYGAQGSTVTANVNGIEFQQGIWRYHPVTKKFELFAEGGGNTWGIDFDRNGNLFAGGNTREPLCHHIQGAYYLKGFDKHGPLHNPYAFGYFNAVRHEGFLGTALTGGFLIYKGGALPAKFNDEFFYPNLRHNALRWSRLQADGSTFTSHYQSDIITAADIWFRPVDCVTGPDGTVYVADWFDYHIAHHDPVHAHQWYIPNKDGRIFRITAAGTNPRPDARLPLRKQSSDALVDLLGHVNDWYSREARRQLAERKDASTYPKLRAMLADAANSSLQLQALWTLYVSGGWTEELAAQTLQHPNEHVRSWTVRLLGDEGALSGPIQKQIVVLAKTETSCIVRSQMACTAKRLAAAQCLPIVAQLLRHSEDVKDPFIPLLLWWAIEDKSVSDSALVLQLAANPDDWSLPLFKTAIVERLARRYAAEGGEVGLGNCARLLQLAPAPADVGLVLKGMETQLEGQHIKEVPSSLREVLVRLLEQGKPETNLLRLALRVKIGAAQGEIMARVADKNVSEADRISLLDILGDAGNEQCVPALLTLVEKEKAPKVRLAAMSALERFSDAKVADAVLKLYPSFDAALKGRAIVLLCNRKAAAIALLDAVDRGQISPKEVTLDQLRNLALHNDDTLNARMEKHWGKVQSTTPKEKQELIKNLRIHLGAKQGQGKLDLVRGEELFQKNCGVCHKLRGKGNAVGPDLTATERKNTDVLLLNIVDPGSVVRQEYFNYIVLTTDGRLLTGLIAEQSPKTITFLDAKNNRTVLDRADIEEMKQSPQSLMPEKLLEPLDNQQIRDLMGYLQKD